MRAFTIYKDDPKDWKELQSFVSEILSDIGYQCSIEKDIATVRGKVNIDVYSENSNFKPKQVILTECKQWNSKVRKTVVHALRTVVNDSGANLGFIISKTGFQSGAIEASQNSNVSLMTWKQFQTYFEEAWLSSMINKVHVLGKPLMDFTDYLGDFYDSEYKLLPPDKQQEFQKAKSKYNEFAWYSNRLYVTNHVTGEIEYLDEAIKERQSKLPIPINSYKDYFYFIKDYCIEGLKEFDRIFGKQVRKG